MNQVVIITGGSRGIGKVLTKRFLDSEYSVVICSRNLNELTITKHELDPDGDKLQTIVADISRIQDCEKLILFTLKKFKRIDVLINNAGIFGPMGLFEENDLNQWIETININLLGTINCCHQIIPFLKKQKHGKIINMSGGGIGGNHPLAHFSAYYTSKGAITCFTEVLASEVAESNIQVNCISPGAVNTFLTDLVLKNGREKAGDYMFDQACKQKSNGGDLPELTAELVMYLVSPAGTGISGKILSSVWDTKELIENRVPLTTSKYTLRRIDDKLFIEKAKQ